MHKEEPDAKSGKDTGEEQAATAQENLAKLHDDYIRYNLINNDALLALLDQLTPTSEPTSEAKASKASR